MLAVSIIIIYFSCRARYLAHDAAAEVACWRGWPGKRTGRYSRRRAFRRIALGRWAHAKSPPAGSAAVNAAAQQTGDIFNNLASFNFLTNAYTKRRINVYTSTFRSRVRTSSSCAEVCLAVLNRAGADYRPARQAVPGWPLVFLPGVLNWPPGDFRYALNGQGTQIIAGQVH